MRNIAATLVFAAVWVACASSEVGGRAGFTECSSGESRACSCDGGATATQTCAAGGTFDPCACAGALPVVDAASSEGASQCAPRDGADGGVKPAKKCQVCDFDVAPSTQTLCPEAPACGNGILGVPSNPTPRADLTVYTENGSAVSVDGGTTPPPSGKAAACLDPQLRIRIAKLKVNKGSGEGYCIIEANDGVTSEAVVTMKTSSLEDGDEFPFPVGQGTLWGQGQPECTSNNLTLTYYCFKVVDNSAWTAALNAVGNTATQIGGSPAGAGPYGWAFGLGGAAANAVAAGIAAAQKDENRIKVQQTIPVDGLLDLANGRSWTVRTRVHDGCNVFGCDRDYDWELTIQAWGCADKLPTPR